MDSLQIKLCDIQGRLFELSNTQQYNSESFIKTFMNSTIAENLDASYNRMQWAGEEYLFEEIKTQIKDKTDRFKNIYSKDILYWIGYIYRYWHFYKNEFSKRIIKLAPIHVMRTNYKMFHTMDPENTIDDLLEIYEQR